MVKVVRCPKCERQRMVTVATHKVGNFIERRFTCRACGHEWTEAKPRK